MDSLLTASAAPRFIHDGLVVVAVDDVFGVGEPVGFLSDALDAGGGDGEGSAGVRSAGLPIGAAVLVAVSF